MVLKTVTGMGYKQSKLDTCLFYKNNEQGLHLVVLYVDDIIIISGDEGEESQVIQGFKDQDTIQDLGTLKHYLGITVEGLADDSVIVHQRSYGISIIKKFAHLISKRCRIGRAISTQVVSLQVVYLWRTNCLAGTSPTNSGDIQHRR
jgi:hypothetical protein